MMHDVRRFIIGVISVLGSECTKKLFFAISSAVGENSSRRYSTVPVYSKY
mgnify:CR=1